METRIIVLKDYDKRVYVETDAPSEEIEESLDYKEEVRFNMEQNDLSDFEIIQNHLQEKGYVFEEVEEDCEEYWW